jgi:multiple sugar transport system substrate-binding protein
MIDVLNAFEAEYNVRVKMQILHWTHARSELVNYALFRDTPDVSDLGSTWLGGFIAMNALRPYQASETAVSGAEEAFLPVVWNSGKTSDGELFAVPWSVDLRNIYYRKDHFEKAGIDEATAFQSIDNLLAAWKALQEYGYRVPIAITTQGTLTVLQYAASWVWQNGGSFISKKGTEPLFNEPAAKEGLYRYFKEHFPFHSAEVRNLDDDRCNDLFWQGNASSVIGGFWLLEAVMRGNAVSVVEQNLGIAALPMPAYVGGNNLVIWKDSRYPAEALQFVQYLTSHKVQVSLNENFALLPARTDALEESLSKSMPKYQQALMQSLRTGRTFSAPYMWGMVESRLLPVVASIWYDLFADPRVDIKNLIDQRVDALATRLAVSLSS